jgi:hypothetical protein
MKKSNIILAVLILSMIALVFSGCGGGGTTPPINHSPTITSITASPQSPIEVDQSTVITCSASDPDGDPLVYTWTKTGGTITGTGSAITWTAPDIEGTYIITCIVSDGELTDEQSISIDVEQELPPDTTEPELIEIASGEIDLNEGGVVEVTDPNSELYGLKLTIEPQKNIRKDKELPVTNIVIYLALLDICKLPDFQGFLITPFIIKSDFTDALFGKLEIPYYMEQIINSGVAINAPVKVCRVSSSPLPWEELSSDKYTVSNNIANISIGIGDFMYYYTLTVNNAAHPNSSGFKSPQPGDLLYKFSKLLPANINEGWCSGHVGIYVGERYDEEEEKPYNVIEALLGGVTRSYHSPISEFGGNSIYLGAREPEGGLSHLQRNKIVAFTENAVGTPYSLIDTLTSMIYSGLGRGNLVKGYGNDFNCVGLAEAAYESEGVGVDLVSNYDEGNEKYGPYHILTPAEQWYRTVPATGLPVLNVPPEISNIEVIPEGSVNTNSIVFITCNATDQDQDNLTYIWTIPEYGNSTTITKGKSISWGSPNEEGTYIISCKVIDNYGGEDEKSINISVGDINVNHAPVITSTAVTSATKDEPYSYDVNATDSDGDTLVYSLTTKPTGMTINSITGLINWIPTAAGDYDVIVEVSDNGSPVKSTTQSFTITVEEVTPPIETWSFLLNINDPVFRGNNKSAVTLNIKNPIDGQNYENLIFKIIINEIDIEDSLWSCAFTFTDSSSGTTAKFSNWGTAEEGFGWVGYWKGPAGNGFSLPVSSNNTFVFDLYCGGHASFGTYNITFQLIDQNNNIILDSTTKKTTVVGPVVILETLSNELKRGSNLDFLTVTIQNPAFSKQYNGYLYFVIYPKDEGLPLFEEYFTIQSSPNQQNGGQPVIPSPWCGDGGYWYGDWGSPGFNIETSSNFKITFDIDVSEQTPLQDNYFEVLLEVPEDGWVAGDYKIVSVK